MKRFAGVTFEGALVPSERAAVVRSLRSAGALATSWTEAGERTYARVELPPDGVPCLAIPGARIDEPALAVLRITPRDATRLPDLERALAGAGRPRGVVDASREEHAIVVAFAPRVTPLDTVVATVDAILERAPGRTIEPLLPLDDTTLVEFAGRLLREPHIDASRLIESHLEPLLARGAP